MSCKARGGCDHTTSCSTCSAQLCCRFADQYHHRGLPQPGRRRAGGVLRRVWRRRPHQGCPGHRAFRCPSTGSNARAWLFNVGASCSRICFIEGISAPEVWGGSPKGVAIRRAVKQLAPSLLHAASVHSGALHLLDVLLEAVGPAHVVCCALVGNECKRLVQEQHLVTCLLEQPVLNGVLLSVCHRPAPCQTLGGGPMIKSLRNKTWERECNL